ncbi:allatostatin A receptor 2 [Haematobia irritans]|uniref:allatostatin A receptor 2 n=1 Tax=Haematobia irritans TaxID=7368 RepID=UPI003F4FA16D
MAEITFENTTLSSYSPVFEDNTTKMSYSDFIENNETDMYPEISELVRVLVPFCFGVIALTGFFGNILVILVVLLNQQMHSTTNLLIVNLAIADLLFVVFCIPFTATDYVADTWPFGDLWCRIVQYLIVVTAFASIYTLVLMSIDRFLAVVHPIRSRMLRTEKITKICICAIWGVILVISLPVTFSHGLVRVHGANYNLELCQFMETRFLSLSVYQIIFFTTSYLLPLMVISGLYVRMITSLWRHGSSVRMSVESQRGRKRVTRLVVVVVIAFASLWLPIQLILLLKALNIFEANTKFKVILQIASQTLAYTSSCINPVLYAFLSDNFRKAFYKAINCTRRHQDYTSDLPPARKTSYVRTSTTGF